MAKLEERVEALERGKSRVDLDAVAAMYAPHADWREQLIADTRASAEVCTFGLDDIFVGQINEIAVGVEALRGEPHQPIEWLLVARHREWNDWVPA